MNHMIHIMHIVHKMAAQYGRYDLQAGIYKTVCGLKSYYWHEGKGTMSWNITTCKNCLRRQK